MPSLTDIPSELLQADKWDALLDWLVGLPIDWDVSRSLIRFWALATGTHLTADQWANAQRILDDDQPTARA